MGATDHPACCPIQPSVPAPVAAALQDRDSSTWQEVSPALETIRSSSFAVAWLCRAVSPGDMQPLSE